MLSFGQFVYFGRTKAPSHLLKWLRPQGKTPEKTSDKAHHPTDDTVIYNESAYIPTAQWTPERKAWREFFPRTLAGIVTCNILDYYANAARKCRPKSSAGLFAATNASNLIEPASRHRTKANPEFIDETLTLFDNQAPDGHVETVIAQGDVSGSLFTRWVKDDKAKLRHKNVMVLLHPAARTRSRSYILATYKLIDHIVAHPEKTFHVKLVQIPKSTATETPLQEAFQTVCFNPKHLKEMQRGKTAKKSDDLTFNPDEGPIIEDTTGGNYDYQVLDLKTGKPHPDFSMISEGSLLTHQPTEAKKARRMADIIYYHRPNPPAETGQSIRQEAQRRKAHQPQLSMVG